MKSEKGGGMTRSGGMMSSESLRRTLWKAEATLTTGTAVSGEACLADSY